MVSIIKGRLVEIPAGRQGAKTRRETGSALLASSHTSSETFGDDRVHGRSISEEWRALQAETLAWSRERAERMD
jgi:hypothetical protein